MAIFEYECSACGEKFEEFVSIADRDKPRKCAVCGKTGAKRALSLFSAPSGGSGSSAGPPMGACGDCPSAGST